MKKPTAWRARGASLIVALAVMLILSTLALGALSTVSTANATFYGELYGLQARYVALACLEYSYNGCVVNPAAPAAGVPDLSFGLGGKFQITRVAGKLSVVATLREAARTFTMTPSVRGTIVAGTTAGNLEIWPLDEIALQNNPRLVPAGPYRPTLVRRATMATGAAVGHLTLADLDADGDLDIVCGSGTNVQVWRNDGNYVFTQTSNVGVGSTVTAVKVADIVAGGMPEVVVGSTTAATGLRVYDLNAALALSLRQTLNTVHDVTGLDVGLIDGDAKLDVVIGRGSLGGGGGTNRIDVFLNTGVAGAELVRGYGAPIALAAGTPFRLALSNINGAGRIDLAIGSSSNNVYEYRNTGGSFLLFTSGTDPTGQDDRDVCAGNMDDLGDPREDLVTVIKNPGGGGGNAVYVFLNATVVGSSTAVYNAAPGSPHALPNTDDGLSGALFDVDGDGHLDVAAGTENSRLYFFRGTGTGAFYAAAPDSASGVPGSPFAATGNVNTVAVGDMY